MGRSARPSFGLMKHPHVGVVFNTIDIQPGSVPTRIRLRVIRAELGTAAVNEEEN